MKGFIYLIKMAKQICKKCNTEKNLQALWAEDNWKKNDKILTKN